MRLAIRMEERVPVAAIVSIVVGRASNIERSYEFYRKAGFRRELMISEPGMRGILNFLSETTVPEAKKAEPMQFFDDRFVRQLNSDK